MTPVATRNLLISLVRRSLAGGRVSVPESVRLYWQWFSELSQARTYQMAGPNPISHAEMEAWSRLRRWPLQAQHVDILRAMDTAWLAGVAARQQRADGKALPISSGQPLTPQAFDAVFG